MIKDSKITRDKSRTALHVEGYNVTVNAVSDAELKKVKETFKKHKMPTNKGSRIHYRDLAPIEGMANRLKFMATLACLHGEETKAFKLVTSNSSVLVAQEDVDVDSLTFKAIGGKKETGKDKEADKEAAEKEAKEKADKEAADKAAADKAAAEKEAAEKEAKEKADKEAADKAAAEKEAKEKADKEAADKNKSGGKK